MTGVRKEPSPKARKGTKEKATTDTFHFNTCLPVLLLMLVCFILQRDLYSLQVKISNLCDAVKRKQIELGLWKRTQTLSTILEAHVSIVF